jgi:hypothetical protein
VLSSGVFDDPWNVVLPDGTGTGTI